MNKNVLIAFGGATLIALVVAMMLSAMLKGGNKEVPVAEVVAKTQIMVATKDIAVGQLLTDDNVAWKDWAADAAFPGTVVKTGDQKPLDALSGRVLRPISAGEPVLKPALAKDSGGFLAAMLKEGTRAVAVRVAPETMAGGFINPGDYVDIVLTYRSHVTYESDDKVLETRMKRLINRNLDQFASETVLQNIKVIGIDQKAVKESGKDDDTSGKVAKTATLEVTPHQAEMLALAGQMGELSLTLRSLGDDKIIEKTDPTVSDARISDIYKEITAQIDENEQASSARRFNVRIYNGGAVTDTPVR